MKSLKQFQSVLEIVKSLIKKNSDLIMECEYADGEYLLIDLVPTPNCINLKQKKPIWEVKQTYVKEGETVLVQNIEILKYRGAHPRLRRSTDLSDGLDTTIKELEDAKWAKIGGRNPND